MAKRTNLASALQNASGKNPAREVITTSERKAKPVAVRDTPANTPPSRQGKKAVTGFLIQLFRDSIKQLALDEDKTVQSLLSEALNDLFVKHDHKPIA